MGCDNLLDPLSGKCDEGINLILGDLANSIGQTLNFVGIDLRRFVDQE